MNWAWLKSKTLWTCVIGLVTMGLTLWQYPEPKVVAIEGFLIAALNMVWRVLFGEAPGTLVIPKTLPELIQAVSESPDIKTNEAARALAAAAKVEKANAMEGSRQKDRAG